MSQLHAELLRARHVLPYLIGPYGDEFGANQFSYCRKRLVQYRLRRLATCSVRCAGIKAGLDDIEVERTQLDAQK